MLAAPRRSPPVLQLANLVGAIPVFVQGEFLFSPAWEFLGLLGLALEQPRSLIGQISLFVTDSDCSVARRPGLRPFAFAQAWALRM